MVSKLKLDMINQSESEKNWYQTLMKSLCNVWDFDSTFLQSVRFWTKFLERFRFWIENYYVLLGFVLKNYFKEK